MGLRKLCAARRRCIDRTGVTRRGELPWRRDEPPEHRRHDRFGAVCLWTGFTSVFIRVHLWRFCLWLPVHRNTQTKTLTAASVEREEPGYFPTRLRTDDESFVWAVYSIATGVPAPRFIAIKLCASGGSLDLGREPLDFGPLTTNSVGS